MKEEELLAKVMGKERCLLTSSGSAALLLAIMHYDVRNKKIIVAANICFIVIVAIYLSGNQPYLVDIDDDGHLDEGKVQEIDDPAIAGVIYAHMYGCVGPIERIKDHCKKKQWFLIEDVAQALGATTINGVQAGSFGDISITSFGCGKIIDLQTGGAIFVDGSMERENFNKIYETFDEENPSSIEQRLNLSKRYFEISMNPAGPLFTEEEISEHGNAIKNKSTLGPVWLASLRRELRNLDENNKVRRENAETLFRNVSTKAGQVVMHPRGSTYWRINYLAINRRDELLRYLKTLNIKCSGYFPGIQGFFQEFHALDLRKAYDFGKQVVNLWSGKESDEAEIVRIGGAINTFFGERKGTDYV